MILIAYIMSGIVLVVSLVKIFFLVLGYIPWMRNTQLMQLEHYIPNWHLFGHRGPTYDCYAILGVIDQESSVETFYPLSQPSRLRSDWIFNPFSKLRFLLRQKIQAYLFYSLSGRSNHWEAEESRVHLERVARHYVKRCLPDSVVPREASIYLVIDNGHFSNTPPRAKSVISVRELY